MIEIIEIGRWADGSIRIYTNCSNGMSFYNHGDSIDAGSVQPTLPGSSDSCIHEIAIYSAAQVSWSVVYRIIPVTVG